MADRKVLVIGLDCIPPELVFDRWRDQLPNLGRLMQEGAYGPLESCIPPITVPAWMSMMTGKDPGRLGFYGFRNRPSFSYKEMGITNSQDVKEKTVWDILGEAGKKVVVVGVPPSYPPKPVNGYVVGCFLTPGRESAYTYPPELKTEIEALVGEYVFDVHDFRTDDKAQIIGQIRDMTDKRFRVVNHLLATKEWDFFIFHEIGPDRIHHGFWSYFDEEHPRHQPGNPYQHAIRDYYIDLDTKIGEILGRLDEDTVVFVVSDHGGKRMLGGICLNEWLIQNGYMTLKERPTKPTPIEKTQVDWTRTAAWGFGGYYGRLFLNVKGREPHGVIPAEDYEKVRDELIAQLSAIPDHRGLPLKTRVYKPQDVYQECRNIPPDLIIYFGDLDWRAVGSIGQESLYVFENDTGPDDANHSEHGIFVMWDPKRKIGQRLSGLQLMDVAPTILKTFGMEPPADMQGRTIVVEGAETAYSDEEEEKVRARLEALGYLA